MTAWHKDNITETPFDLRLLDWLRDHPGQTVHQIAMGLGVTGKFGQWNQWIVQESVKRLHMRHLVRYEERPSPGRHALARYWSAVDGQ